MSQVLHVDLSEEALAWFPTDGDLVSGVGVVRRADGSWEWGQSEGAR